MCFVYDAGRLVAVGRALADGRDCAYISGVAVHPDHQGLGLGRAVVTQLVNFSREHKKIILYAAQGKSLFIESSASNAWQRPWRYSRTQFEPWRLVYLLMNDDPGLPHIKWRGGKDKLDIT